MLKDKIALITGAGSGIGRATALRFAAEGARVAVCDIDAAACAETVRLIGGEAFAAPADVASPAAAEALVASVVKRFGRLDCACNNAGVSGGSPGIDDWDEALFARAMSINAQGTFLCMKHEVKQMLAQGGGAIVNVASTAGLVGVGAFAYTMSKHAIIGLTRAAGVRYAGRNIRVNAVCPGSVKTPLLERALQKNPDAISHIVAAHPIGRVAEADEIAAAVVWLCSDEARYIAGHPLVVDGGYVAQ